MLKITFLGAGSTVFARNVLGDVMCTPSLRCCEIALYDIDPVRLRESEQILQTLNRNINESRAVIRSYLGPENRREALRGVLAQDPRPSYQDDPERVYGMSFGGMEVKFKVDGENLTVCGVE